MRLGALVLQTRPWDDFATVCRQIEAFGFDVVYVGDHLTHPSVPGRWLADGWTLLAAAATVTERLELGTLVSSTAVRQPVPLARAAATVNDISGGRVVLGIGAGNGRDAAADHGDTPPFGRLSARLAETLEAFEALWGGAPEWQGKHVAFSGVQTLPLPPGTERPFLMVAAHGPRGFELVARYGDGWNTLGGPAWSGGLGVEEYWSLLGQQSVGVEAACERAGRDATQLRRSLLLGFGPVRPGDDVPGYVEAAERASQAGFDELVLPWPDGKPGDPFWAETDTFREAVGAIHAALG